MTATITRLADIPAQDTLDPEAAALIAAVLEWTPTPEFLAAEARMTGAGVEAVLEASGPSGYFR